MILLHTSGVYLFRNKVNGKVYIGSTTRCLILRRRDHVRNLYKNNHCNIHFQRAWNKHGSISFVWELVERCSPEECLVREQYWIDHYSSSDDNYGYNICPRAGSSFGSKHSEQTKRKLSRIKSNPSDETRKKLSIAAKNRTAEHTQRIRVARAGFKHSEETKARISRSTKAAYTQELRDKISLIHKGKAKTPEHKANIAKALLGKKHSAARIAARKKRTHIKGD